MDDIRPNVRIGGSWLPHYVLSESRALGTTAVELNSDKSGPTLLFKDGFLRPEFLLQITAQAVSGVHKFNQICGGDGRYDIPVVRRFQELYGK